jgi:hypothetical protein
MFLSPRFLGVLIGLTAAGALLWLGPRTAQKPARTGPPLSECDGAIKSVVIQYVHGADFTLPVYREFLRQLPADVLVYAMCPDRAAFDELAAAVGPTVCRIEPVLVAHEMTCWSRDRWAALTPASTGQPTTLLAPRGEAGAETWPQREGDQRVAFDLAAAFSDRIAARRSSLYFDGGDFLADGRCVFVTASVIRRNLQNTVASVDGLKRQLEQLLGQKVVLLENCPDHHAGMFMMAAGDGTVLVGDPSLGRAYAHPVLPGGADFTEQTQAKFDSVARDVAAAGYRVVRIPVMPGMDGKTYLTYVNAIIDQRDGQRTVYMPTYRGAEAMNDAAEAVWRGVGYEVHRIDCTSTYTSFGNLHCLVNVLERRPL